MDCIADSRWWVVLVSLLLAAVQTVSATGNIEQLYLEPTESMQIDSDAFLAYEPQGKCNDIALSSAAKDYLNIPTEQTQRGGVLPINIKTMPPVPAAILMTVMGFLCISFIRDRRAWLTGLAFIMWAGQIGINALPQFAQSLTHRNYKSGQSAQLSFSPYLKNFSRQHNNTESRQYIGLLHHLEGIPADVNFTESLSAKVLGRQIVRKLDTAPRWVDGIIPLQAPNLLLRCFIKRTEQLHYFSPAFIFENLARGPPIPA